MTKPIHNLSRAMQAFYDSQEHLRLLAIAEEAINHKSRDDLSLESSGRPPLPKAKVQNIVRSGDSLKVKVLLRGDFAGEATLKSIEFVATPDKGGALLMLEGQELITECRKHITAGLKELASLACELMDSIEGELEAYLQSKKS